MEDDVDSNSGFSLIPLPLSSIVAVLSQVCDGAEGQSSSAQRSDPAGWSSGGSGGPLGAHTASQRAGTDPAASREHTPPHHHPALQ